MKEKYQHCKNCGAILKSTKCEYCGTEYIIENNYNYEIDKLKQELKDCESNMKLLEQTNEIMKLIKNGIGNTMFHIY